MRKRLINFVALLVVLCCIAAVVWPSAAFAHGCPNNNCDGYNPQTMGCSATTGGRLNVPDGGLVETRNSQGCNAKWTRTTNVSGANRFLAATTWYGGANYDDNVSVRTYALVSNTEAVYTVMKTPLGRSVLSCGLANRYGMITIPVSKNKDVWCPKAN